MKCQNNRDGACREITKFFLTIGQIQAFVSLYWRAPWSSILTEPRADQKLCNYLAQPRVPPLMKPCIMTTMLSVHSIDGFVIHWPKKHFILINNYVWISSQNGFGHNTVQWNLVPTKHYTSTNKYFLLFFEVRKKLCCFLFDDNWCCWYHLEVLIETAAKL